MVRVLTLCIVTAASPWMVTAQTKVIEHRGVVTYSAADWSHDTNNTVDVPAQPVGGIRALVSQLDYPQSLRRQNVRGTVRIRLSLDSNGRIESAQILQSANSTLDAIVLKAAQNTRWKPAMRKGKPVAWKFSFPVTFIPPSQGGFPRPPFNHSPSRGKVRVVHDDLISR
jgi:TonB family protein